MQRQLCFLPFAAFHANLACHLRDLWIEIESTIEMVTPDEQQGKKYMEMVIKQAEDANETLFYLQDLLETTNRNNPQIYGQLKNAILNYAYYPTVIQSLCSLKLKPQLSISTCIYILQQTFHIVKDPGFCREIFSSIFLPRIPQKVLMRIEKQWQSLNPTFTKPARDIDVFTDEEARYPTTYEPQHNSAYYFPLFKRPIHVRKFSLSQLVMIYHSTTEE